MTDYNSVVHRAFNDYLQTEGIRTTDIDLNSAVYETLGDLGFTGSLNERIISASIANDISIDNLWSALYGLTTVVGGGAVDPIAALFANGENGFWLDPSDATTRFQDSAGTTAASADSDPNGLLLDKSKWGGLSYSAMLAAQPLLEAVRTFDNSTGITLNSWTVSGGTLNKAAGDTTSATVALAAPLVAGKIYQVEFDLTVSASGVRVALRVGVSGTNSQGATYLSSGRASCFIVATAAHDSIQFQVLGSSFTGSIDNLAIKEVPGNHVIQATSDARPLYKTDGTLHWLEADGVDDQLLAPALFPIIPTMSLIAVFSDHGDVASAQTFSTLGTTNGSTQIYIGSRSNAGVYYPSGNHRVQAGAVAAINLTNNAITKGLPVIGALVCNGTAPEFFARDSAGSTETKTVSVTSSGTLDVAAGVFARVDAGFVRRFYGGLMIDRALTADEVAAAIAHFAPRGGITLD